ncbi:peroxisomal membrane [Blastocystis sp. subtype 4]|uniref:peroxisomal membrane n=1 Tax=Blastocystis sp. subtype 4 TaxID=944170 RepID=UPI000711BF07|nr:peroxisomal membrane [Blastocystis sp. subtype 4]KNB42076.1 peroxisomal membrane [Blastocystis sp. subtype 4]|eukprot:XP_014525519.1 peroxisomal membrane [Blastocystis sp. subtype 4]
MNVIAVRTPSLLMRVGLPMLSSSCVFGCTLFVGDLLGQYFVSPNVSLDWKRSLCMGVSGFFVSGPLNFTVNRIVHKLYPGRGRLTVLKRIAMTTTISPLTIACGIIPSTFLYSRDMDVVHKKVVNRVPLNWMMSMLLLSPFSYIHARFVVRRFQKVTRNSYNVIYNSVLSGKNNRSKLDDEFIFDFLL